MAFEVALDLVAAQVADKDIADGEIPVAADRVMMIDGEIDHGERASAIGTGAGAERLRDSAQFGERVGKRTASSLGLVTADVAGSAGDAGAMSMTAVLLPRPVLPSNTVTEAR